ncbi:MAG: MerR family transcriptional regulator [Thomasclavelia sp.]
MEKYSYREFAKMAGTTIRTLRYYEQINLIEPVIIKGKKYLDESYFVSLQTIDLLKKAGYTLDEVKHIIKDRNVEEQIIMQKDLLNIQLTNIKAMLSLIDELQEKDNLSISKIYNKFLHIQNRQNLQLQFETADGLKTRVLFHHQHTKYTDNFHQWMFSHYKFNPNDKILEIGCGDGTLWKCNQRLIPQNIEITLSDISKKMIAESFNQLHAISQIKAYDLADCYHLPYDDESFDVVIINHVLMYFDNLDQALKEIYRVLKTNGTLYCSTIARDMMKERDEILKQFDPKISFDQEILYQRFGFENGKEKLAKYFEQIDLFERKEVYEVKDLDLLYRFILSAKGLSLNLEPLYRKKKQFYQYLQNYFNKYQVFNLTTHAAMFKARKGEKNGKCQRINF